MARRKKQTNKPTKKQRGPYLAAAFFCDQVVKGSDEALTPVRITDQIHVAIAPNAPADFPSKENRIPVQMAALLSFKTGDFPGEHTVRILMESPSGDRSEAHLQKVQFSEPPHGGANLILQNTVRVYRGGLFWFNVYLDDRLMTRMPLHITYGRQEPAFAPVIQTSETEQPARTPVRRRITPVAKLDKA
jgi:hypothetical protein